MKKIIVTGAGLGGLTAAANLAKNGYDVTVIEQKERTELGYDWRDTLVKDVFVRSGVQKPSETHFEPHVKVCYRNPNKSMKLVDLNEPSDMVVNIDRQFLAQHLVSYAQMCGVKIEFGIKAVSAIVDEGKVTGIATEDGEFLCDLVIDAGGMHSAVRDSLPDVCGIVKSTKKTDTLYTYRAYYERLSDEMSDPPFHFYFYHMRRKGIDWVITDKKYIDILIGSFSPLTQQDIDAAVEDFRKEFPYMGEKIVRGGQTATIPLGRTFPVIVCDGYAAVGDSAVMIEPLSGSGMTQSMLGGKMLADNVVEIGSGEFTKENLWKYQYNYFKEIAEKNLPDDVIKGFLSDATPDDVDYLMESRILTEKEFSGGSDIKLTIRDILIKLKALLKRPLLLFKIAKLGINMLKIKKACELMPEKYDEAAIEKWKEKYLAI